MAPLLTTGQIRILTQQSRAAIRSVCSKPSTLARRMALQYYYTNQNVLNKSGHFVSFPAETGTLARRMALQYYYTNQNVLNKSGHFVSFPAETGTLARRMALTI